MHAPRRIRTFTLRHPLVGPVFWMLSIQYFLTQYFVARAWPVPHSIQGNVISDLGNTECAMYAGRYVCSPAFTWMNSSFIVLGITIIIGSTLIYQGFKKTRASRAGFYMMALAGLGSLLVGLFPENSIGVLHSLGAFLVFVFGNMALVTLGLALDIPKLFKSFTIGLGILASVALLFFVTHNYLWLGPGGMERLVAYPQTIWLVIFGVYVSTHQYRVNKNAGH